MLFSSSITFSHTTILLLTIVTTLFFQPASSASPSLEAQALLPPEGLPLRTHVFADNTCSRSRAHLHYVPDGFCVGPLYFPASSIRLSNAVPENCTLMAYKGGRCQKGTEVSMSWNGGEQVVMVKGRLAKRSLWGTKQAEIVGPTGKDSCFGVGVEDDSLDHAGKANSFFLQCTGAVS